MKLDPRKSRSAMIGWLLIVIGVAVNQWTIGYLRPVPRPIVQIKNLILIWGFEGALILAGVIVLFFRGVTEDQLKRWYKNTSAAIVAIVLGFIIMNVALYASSVVKLSLAGINPVAEKYGVSALDLYPGFTNDQYAQLMKETWSRGFVYEPFTTFKEGPYRGTYVNVDANGFRYSKDQESWPPKKENFNVFLFGNSTAFNYGVPDNDTIASDLQTLLKNVTPNKKVAIYNFGRGYFYSSQERALLDELLVAGHKPDVAIFLDGYLDMDPTTLPEVPHFSEDISSFFNGPASLGIFDNLPVVTWVHSLFKSGQNQATSTGPYVPSSEDIAGIETSIQRYATNKKLIEATSKAYGITSLFVWQPISGYHYTPEHDPFLKASIDSPGAPIGYPYMAAYVAKHDMGNNFLYLADMQRGRKEPLYVDGVHYSIAWSKEIAKRIADAIMTRL